MKMITPKEQDILELIGEGYSARKIAEVLKISINTVQTHRRSLLKKFDAANAAQLVKKSLQSRLKAKK